MSYYTDMETNGTNSQPATKSVYVQGLGYMPADQARAHQVAKDLRREISALRILPVEVTLDSIVLADTGRVQFVLSSVWKPALASSVQPLVDLLRAKFPGVKLYRSKVRGFSLWNCYFSDGNWNCYAAGVEIGQQDLQS